MSLETLSLKIKMKVSVQIIRVSGPQPKKIIEAYHWYLAAILRISIYDGEMAFKKL